MIQKKYILFFLFSLVIMIYSGCSSSSNSIRYNKEQEEENEKDNSVRFTSKDYEQIPDDSLYADLEDEEDDIPSEEPSIDISSVLQKYGSSNNTSNMNADNSTVKERILMEIIRYLNTPYKYGGNSKNGIDCSAFTQTVYKNTLSILLLRSAREQYTQGTVVESKDQLQFGDLVFFNTRRRVRPGHVGIYIGENLFAHASSKKGVIVSSLDHDYYSRTFMGARRIDDLYSNVIN